MRAFGLCFVIYIIFIPWLFSPVARKCNGDTFQDLIVRVCRIQHITGYLRPEASQIGYFTLELQAIG